MHQVVIAVLAHVMLYRYVMHQVNTTFMLVGYSFRLLDFVVHQFVTRVHCTTPAKHHALHTHLLVIAHVLQQRVFFEKDDRDFTVLS